MQALNADATTTGSINSVSKTCAAPAEALASPGFLEIDTEGWRTVIIEPLSDWARDPMQLEDEGVDAPSQELISFALDVAMFLRDQGWRAPHRVVPSGDGGIVFKRQVGDFLEEIEFGATGTIEMFCFEKSKIIYRRRMFEARAC